MSRHRQSRTLNSSCTAYIPPSSGVCSCASTRDCTRKQRSPMYNAIRMNRGERCSSILLVFLVAMNWFAILRHTSMHCPQHRVKKYPRRNSFSRIHALVRHLEAYEHTLPAHGEKVPEEELLSTIHELVRLITTYENAVSTQREGVPEEELLSNRNLVERLKQIRRGL